MASAGKNWVARFMLLCVATIVGLGLCEFVLRMMSPGETFSTAQELPWLRGMDAPDTAQFEISPEFGFLPVMDDAGDNELNRLYRISKDEYDSFRP